MPSHLVLWYDLWAHDSTTAHGRRLLICFLFAHLNQNQRTIVSNHFIQPAETFILYLLDLTVATGRAMIGPYTSAMSPFYCLTYCVCVGVFKCVCFCLRGVFRGWNYPKYGNNCTFDRFRSRCLSNSKRKKNPNLRVFLSLLQMLCKILDTRGIIETLPRTGIR